MSEAKYSEEEKSFRRLYIVCDTDPAPTSWLELCKSVSMVTPHIHEAIKEADASGKYWSPINAIERRGRYYLDENCAMELTVSL